MELFIGEFFLRSLCYCITIDFCSTTSLPQPVLLRKASVLTTCLRNVCLAVKARFWNFNINDHRAFSSCSVVYSDRATTVVGNANGKFILTPTIYNFLSEEQKQRERKSSRRDAH